MSSPMERLSFLPDFPGRESLYHPLDANKDEVRVITIAPSHERSSTIHCFLETISIQDGRSTKPYDAISYVWGSTETTENLIVHNALSFDQPDSGVEVPVTYALTGALRQFRAKATGSEKLLVLWTDAVCIHQLDAAERSQQVTIMPCVFHTATSVLVWLGEGNPAAELGLVNLFGLAMCRQTDGTDRDHSKEAFANLFGQTVCRQTDGADRDRSMDAFDYNDYDAEPDLESLERVNDIFLNFGNPGGYDKSCRNVSEMGGHMVSWVNSISALRDLSYWYRGWTFQEAYVNEHVSLCYAKTRCRVISWRHLWLVVFWRNGLLDWLGETKALPAMLNFTNWVFFAWFTWDAVRLSKWNIDAGLLQSHDGKFLFDSLTMNLWTIARSTRRTADPRDQVYSQIGAMTGLRLLNLKPDYTLTTEQVFITTTLAILHASRSWSYSQFFVPSESPFMPSWAIDFTLVPDLEAHRFGYEFGHGKFSADSSATFRLEEQHSERLHTAGFVYDAVATGHRCDRLSGTDTTCVEIVKVIEKDEVAIECLLDGKYVTDLGKSIFRTWCMGMVGDQKFDLIQDDFASVFRETLKRARLAHMKGMSFIVTVNGHLGMVAANVHAGDGIAILAGGSVPFVVREVGELDNYGDSFILLGGCYLDGIMYGEATRERARDVYESRRRSDPDFALWRREHRELINWNMDLGELSLSSDLAFPMVICLV